MEIKRNTVQKQLIFNAVKELNSHATAEQVVAYLLEKHPAIGRATVYRNLNRMTESGELIKIASCYGSTHYDHNSYAHTHFICKDCKRIFDIDADYSHLLEMHNNKEGFDITGFHVTFSGICWKCKK